MNKNEEYKEAMGHHHQAEQYTHFENTRRKRKGHKNYLMMTDPKFPNLSG